MRYAAKELFKILQGEGAQAGRAAIFRRFAGVKFAQQILLMGIDKAETWRLAEDGRVV